MSIVKIIVFYVMVSAITIVSGIDVYFTVETQDTIINNEQNPIAKWIMECTSVSVFIGLKLITTVFTVLLLQIMLSYAKISKYALMITFGIMLFQLGLLCYMYIDFYGGYRAAIRLSMF